jgi:SAM-dependent methyltransferase
MPSWRLKPAVRRAWWEHAGPLPFQTALVTFGILALELALIRWSAGQIRAFAYFGNLVLIAAFLGMGLGLALGRRYTELVHATLPALVLISLALGLAEPLHLIHLSFPDPSVHLWGAESSTDTGVRILHLSVFLALVGGIIGVFIFAGSALGVLFSRQPTLKAYRYDLVGSLLGVVAMTCATAAGGGPGVWLTLGVLPFIWICRRPVAVASGVVSVSLAVFSGQSAVFSPYNRIDIESEGSDFMLAVNRDFHQYMHDLSDRRLAATPPQSRADVARVRTIYDLPFSLGSQRSRALVVGAGTGNDVQAALRVGYDKVVSVDIDGSIIELGRRLHPERPYDDPRVEPVVDDARAYFRRRVEPFDVVVFGLLDSHAMFSSLSTLRLDNYVYSEEGIRAAWRHVGPRGYMAISFSVFGGPWMADRLYWTIARATGREPIAFSHGMHYGAIFIVPSDGANLDFSGVDFPRIRPGVPLQRVRTTSDDWPFLYVRPGIFPWGYVLVLVALATVARVATPFAFGRSTLGADFDIVLFFMGAAFLLIETRGVTTLSLLLGSTWIVNAAVFGGVLVMALLANEAVLRLRPHTLGPWFVGLLASVALLWIFPLSMLNALGVVERGILGGLLNALPVAFAGVIVSTRLSQSRNASAALGSNLLGSVIGGCLEYLSMMVGLRALALLALALYLAALFVVRRDSRVEVFRHVMVAD